MFSKNMIKSRNSDPNVEKLNVKDMAEIVGMSENFIRSLCAKQIIPAKKGYANMWYCGVNEFKKYICENESEDKLKKLHKYVEEEKIARRNTINYTLNGYKFPNNTVIN